MDLTGVLLGGRYKVDGELCSGYFGTTWRASDLSTSNNRVCIKVKQSMSVSCMKQFSRVPDLVELF